MQRNIIVQQWRIKPNGERLDLSIKEQPVKPSTSKTQQDIHMKFIFDELELGMEMNTSSKFTHG